MIRWLAGTAALLSMLATAALSNDKAAPDTPEPRSVEAIAKATGESRCTATGRGLDLRCLIVYLKYRMVAYSLP
jgi:hypothetical protein